MSDFGAGKHLVLGPGWASFTDPEHYLRYALVLLAATASGAILAYHPVHRGRVMLSSDLEQRKTLIIYSVVGALIAVICAVNPSMAFVIFGIGGLMRFRTDVGESKHTGHTIMATLVGLCWGLGLQLVAVLATLYFWGMIYVLEGNPVLRLTVTGVAPLDMPRCADAYRQVLARTGCRILGHEKLVKTLQIVFVLRLPKGTTAEHLSKELLTIPEPLRAAPDFSE
jgi:hypothetical protein